MAQTPEGKVKAAVKKILEKKNVWYFMPFMMGMGRVGIPDFIACVNGTFLAIECKAGKGELTALQERELLNIEFAGGVAVVVREDTLTDLEKGLEELLDERT